MAYLGHHGQFMPPLSHFSSSLEAGTPAELFLVNLGVTTAFLVGDLSACRWVAFSMKGAGSSSLCGVDALEVFGDFIGVATGGTLTALAGSDRLGSAAVSSPDFGGTLPGLGGSSLWCFSR